MRQIGKRCVTRKNIIIIDCFRKCKSEKDVLKSFYLKYTTFIDLFYVYIDKYFQDVLQRSGI